VQQKLLFQPESSDVIYNYTPELGLQCHLKLPWPGNFSLLRNVAIAAIFLRDYSLFLAKRKAGIYNRLPSGSGLKSAGYLKGLRHVLRRQCIGDQGFLLMPQGKYFRHLRRQNSNAFIL
jgi:hypothetical protein